MIKKSGQPTHFQIPRIPSEKCGACDHAWIAHRMDRAPPGQGYAKGPCPPQCGGFYSVSSTFMCRCSHQSTEQPLPMWDARTVCACTLPWSAHEFLPVPQANRYTSLRSQIYLHTDLFYLTARFQRLGRHPLYLVSVCFLFHPPTKFNSPGARCSASSNHSLVCPYRG